MSADEIAIVPTLIKMAEDVGHIKEAVASLKDGQEAAVAEAKLMQCDIAKLAVQGEQTVKQNDIRNGRIELLETRLNTQTVYCAAIQDKKELSAADVGGYNRRVMQEKRWLRKAWKWGTDKAVFGTACVVIGIAVGLATKYDGTLGEFLMKVVP